MYREGTFVAIHYNKPYLEHSSSPWYKGLGEYFKYRHGENKEKVLNQFEYYGAETSKFMGKETYYLSILER